MLLAMQEDVAQLVAGAFLGQSDVGSQQAQGIRKNRAFTKPLLSSLLSRDLMTPLKVVKVQVTGLYVSVRGGT
jgi:hypothetical protein